MAIAGMKKLPQRCGSIVLAAIGLGVELAAQCTPTSQAENTLPGIEGTVSQFVRWDPDGSGPQAPILLASGYIASAGSAFGPFVRIDPQSGLMTGFGQGISSFGSPLGQLIPGNNGRLYAQVGTTLYRWTGSTFAPYLTGLQVSGLMVELPNGDLVLSGQFAEVQGVPAQGLARWDGVQWHAMGLAGNSNPGFIKVLANGQLAVSGVLNLGSGPDYNFGLWSNGTWQFLPGAPQGSSRIAQFSNGDLLVSVINGPVSLRRWNGSSWSDFTTSANNDISSLTITANDEVVVGGNFFASFEGVPAARIARFANGSWSGLGSGLFGNCFAVQDLGNGELLAGGSFVRAGEFAASKLARWNGSEWLPLQPGLAGPVEAVLPIGSDDVVLGGEFQRVATANGVPATGIVRRQNGIYRALGTGVDSTVLALLRSGNGDLIAGGLFQNAGGQPSPSIARWNGSVWSPLGTGTNGSVHTVVELANGDLLAGGYFSLAGNVSSTGIARWNGSSWSSPGTFDGGVEALAVLPDGDVVAGGIFNVVNGNACNGTAIFDGQSWQPMGAGLGFVRRLQVANGVLYAAHPGGVSRWDNGSWTLLPALESLGSSSIGELANGDLVAAGFLGSVQRWDGSQWQPLAAVGNGRVRAIASGSQGELWLGGWYGRLIDAGGERVAHNLASVRTGCLATATVYGAGCSSSAGPVEYRSETQPWLGAVWRTRCSGVPSNAIALQLFGDLFPIPLPQLLPEGKVGCTLLALPIDQLPLVPNAGVVTSSLALPLTPALIGSELWSQVAPIEFSASGALLEVTTSNALVARFGSW